MKSSYNSRCPGVKRLLKEAQELHEPTEEYFAQPLEDNLFEWHFTVRGPPDTDFEGGIYHGRIILPPDYPMKPPSILFLTANGRFETNKKICLSISGHHPETWQPSWSIRTALLAIIGFMPTPAHGTLGGLEYTPAERKILSRKSTQYVCPDCGRIEEHLKVRTGSNSALQEEAKELSAQMTVTSKKDENETTNSNVTNLESVIGSDGNQDSSTLSNTSNEDSSDATTSTNNTVTTEVEGSEVPLTASTNTNSSYQRQRTLSSSSFPKDFLLSAAVILLIALLLRRIFLMESDLMDDMEEILM